MRYQWLLFDADNTILDFTRAKDQALAATLQRWGVPVTQQVLATYESINHRLWQAFERQEITAAQLREQRFVDFLAAVGVEADAAAMSADFLAALGQQVALLDGAKEVIPQLAQHYRLFLITNGLREVQRRRWQNFPLRRYFAGILISDEVGVAKPDPRIFDIAFARMGHPRRTEVLMIGDSLSSDMAGGIAYGLDTCWLNLQGAPRPDGLPITYEIRSLRELAPLLTGKGDPNSLKR